VVINDDLYTLGRKDVAVLSFLLQNFNFTVSRKGLISSIGEVDNERSDNILDISIAAIRRILRMYPDLAIKNVYGDGYKMAYQ
jgi:Response regulators consisting of a CheY-like receiver domain and a winged-helix DNA-binding domain